MPQDIQKIKVGFDPRDGSLLTHTSPKKKEIEVWHYDQKNPFTGQPLVDRIPITWQDNCVFKATFKVVRWVQDRCSSFIYLRENNFAGSASESHMMKFFDFMDMAKHGQHRISNGEIEGEFTYHRSGGVCSVVPYFQ